MAFNYEGRVLGFLDSRHKMTQRKAFAVERRNKFNAKKCERDGYIFDSLKEGREYDNLKTRLLAGEIRDLKIHPAYQIFINDQIVCKVEMDFEYYDNQINSIRYIDVKGLDTPISKLKRKMLEAQLSIRVELA